MVAALHSNTHTNFLRFWGSQNDVFMSSNHVITKGQFRVVQATNNNDIEGICPYPPHDCVCKKGGEDDGTRGGRERALSSLVGMDFLLLYKDSGRRAIARFRLYGSRRRLIADIIPMQETQVRRGMLRDFPCP
jgi:hypothetical protein